MPTDDPYGDILADRSVGGISGAKRLAESYRSVTATPGMPLLHRSSGIRGKLRKFTGEIVVIIDAKGGEHTFENHAGAFAHNGETVTLARVARPDSAEPSLTRTAAGALVDSNASARVARASRIWVEGDHDARFLERVWGDELRELGIVVEPLGGIDDLEREVQRFAPSPQRRLAVLVDHLVPGSKETRIVNAVTDPNVMIVGHPFVDIWQCVRPKALGIEAWPEVPIGEDWKSGVCRRLGWANTADGWRRVLSSVNSFADLEPSLVGAVEMALDMLTQDDEFQP
ncbi:MAG: DUF3097 family protein [Microthrixaceae bacterium]|nr:DUF3097 family protein [Microthrixaceae bacterium]